MKKLLLFILLFSFTIADLITPENGSTISRTHVLFEWELENNIANYHFQLSHDENFYSLIFEDTTFSTIHIQKENIDWNQNYFWRVKGIDGDWINQFQFETGNSISNAYTNEISPNLTQDGLTAFGSFFNYYSAIIDNSGNEIWNSGNDNFIYYSTNKWGQIFGSLYLPSLENNLPGVEINSGNEIIWQEPNDHFLHHELIQLPNGNYMGIVETAQFGPIPPGGSWSQLFQAVGYQVDGVTPEFTWVGDRIVEWDAETGEEVWSWSTFDHYNMNDYDIAGGTWMEAYQANRYDWTHANALAFEENEIYISSRHLSRITKIEYPSGDIIWNMGLEHGAGDIDFGEDLNFSFQHSLQILENGNLTTLDNGNLSQHLYGTDYPTSRGLEIQINNNSEAEIVWEYVLPQNLFGFASGNVQKLENNNYLITTVGDGGTSLEVNPYNEIVWEGKYNLTLPAGAVYRAQKIRGIYPGSYSIVFPNANVNFDTNQYEFDHFHNNLINIGIKNNSNYYESYNISLIGNHPDFNDQDIILDLPPQGFYNSQFEGNINLVPHNFTLKVTPIHFPHKSKEYNLTLDYSNLNNTSPEIPNSIYLNTYPNPFNGSIMIDYFIEQSGDVLMEIRDVNGQFIELKKLGYQINGAHQVVWDSDKLTSGIYLISIQTEHQNKTKKITLLK